MTHSVCPLRLDSSRVVGSRTTGLRTALLSAALLVSCSLGACRTDGNGSAASANSGTTQAGNAVSGDSSSGAGQTTGQTTGQTRDQAGSQSRPQSQSQNNSVGTTGTSAGSSGVTSTSSMKTINGTVTYLSRRAIPLDSMISVKLEDVSRADAPAVLIAGTRMTSDGRQVPIPFALEYDPTKIQSGRRYSLRATIHRPDGRADEMLFTTTRSYPVFTDGRVQDGRVALTLEPARRGAVPEPTATTAALEGPRWRLKSLGGTAVIRERGAPDAGISFMSESSSFAGNTGINNFAGGYTLKGDSLSITPGPMTMMAGPENLTKQEQSFVKGLTRVTGWKIEGGVLKLMARRDVVMELERE